MQTWLTGLTTILGLVAGYLVRYRRELRCDNCGRRLNAVCMSVRCPGHGATGGV